MKTNIHFQTFIEIPLYVMSCCRCRGMAVKEIKSLTNSLCNPKLLQDKSKDKTKIYQMQTYHKKDYPLWLLPSSQRCKNTSIYINVIISLLKDKNLTIISICTKKLLIKYNMFLCVKIPRKSRTEGNRPQHNKSYIWKTHSQQHPKWWKHGSSPLKSVIRQGCLWSLILFNANFEALSRA